MACFRLRCELRASSGSIHRLRGLVLLYQSEVLIEEAVAVMAEGEVVGEVDNFRGGMGTGFLFFRWQPCLKACSILLVQR